MVHLFYWKMRNTETGTISDILFSADLEREKYGVEPSDTPSANHDSLQEPDDTSNGLNSVADVLDAPSLKYEEHRIN